MKKIAIVAAIAVIVLASAVSSCKKTYVAQTYAYTDTFNMHYGYHPDIAGGFTPALGLPAWFPNEGTGASSVMPSAKIFFEMYARWNAAYTGADNVPMSVNRTYAATLAGAGITVPNDVTQVVYDNQQNAVWFKAVTVTTKQTSPTRIDALSEYDIVGGSGKFKGATGHIVETGWFNPVDTTMEGASSKGTITY